MHPTHTPMQYITGVPTDYSHFKCPFGTVAYVLRHDRLKSESRKAHPGLVVGFPAHRKGLLVHVPAMGRLVATRHYVLDRSIVTKAQRSKLDWLGNHPFTGELPQDNEEEGSGQCQAPPSPKPSTTVRSAMTTGTHHHMMQNELQQPVMPSEVLQQMHSSEIVFPCLQSGPCKSLHVPVSN